MREGRALPGFRRMLGVCVCLLAAAATAHASVITYDDVIPITGEESGSGNGTLDLILFSSAGGGGVLS